MTNKYEIMDLLGKALNIVIEPECHIKDQALIIKKLVELLAILDRELIKEALLESDEGY